MQKLAAACVSGEDFIAVTDNNEIVRDDISQGRTLEKVFPGYVPGDESEIFLHSAAMRNRKVKYGNLTRRQIKKDADRHQREKSRRDHGNARQLVAYCIAANERRDRFHEELGELIDSIGQMFSEETEKDFDIVLSLHAIEVSERQAA